MKCYLKKLTKINICYLEWDSLTTISMKACAGFNGCLLNEDIICPQIGWCIYSHNLKSKYYESLGVL